MIGTPYCGLPPVPGGASWNLDPLLLTVLALAGLALAWMGRGQRRAGAISVAGWLVLCGALVSPLCNIAVALFVARVAQHLLITLVAAPLVGGARCGPRDACCRQSSSCWHLVALDRHGSRPCRGARGHRRRAAAARLCHRGRQRRLVGDDRADPCGRDDFRLPRLHPRLPLAEQWRRGLAARGPVAAGCGLAGHGGASHRGERDPRLDLRSAAAPRPRLRDGSRGADRLARGACGTWRRPLRALGSRGAADGACLRRSGLRFAGLVGPVRRVTFDNVRVFWFYTVAQALAGLALTHAFPRLVGSA